MWVFWAYVAAVVLIPLGIFAWYWLPGVARRKRPRHSGRPATRLERIRRTLHRKPASTHRAARRSARAGQRAAWGRYLRGSLRRLVIWSGIKARRPHRPQAARPELIQDQPELSHEPGDDGPDDPAWARELREQVDDPNAHLQRNWPEGDSTGTFQRDMLDRMIRDGQMPPAPVAPPNRTEEWLARTERAGDPDAFMGREPAQDPEDDGDTA